MAELIGLETTTQIVHYQSGLSEPYLAQRLEAVQGVPIVYILTCMSAVQAAQAMHFATQSVHNTWIGCVVAFILTAEASSVDHCH